MKPGIPSGLGLALAWFAFPLVPTLLGTACYQFSNGDLTDPRDWGSLPWTWWVTITGPLVAYGFLAGATLDLPDEPGRRWPMSWFSRRSTWVAIGPWVGFVPFYTIFMMIFLVQWAYPPSSAWTLPKLPAGWDQTWAFWLLGWAIAGTFWYGWIFVVGAALWRAKRLDRLGRSLTRGLAMAVGFVGSLFGSFWAITEAWRAYFFDTRIVPVLVASVSLALMSGCAKTLTYGEVRRRDLFQAMLTAWLLGLAIAWRWWSRSRPKPGPPSAS